MLGPVVVCHPACTHSEQPATHPRIFEFIALLVAARNGHTETALALINDGESLEATNNDGKTPLQIATENDTNEFIDIVKKFNTYKITTLISI